MTTDNTELERRAEGLISDINSIIRCPVSINLIAEMRDEIRAKTKREQELLELIKEIRADLHFRGENDSDGVRVLDISRGILHEMNVVINQEGNNKCDQT